MGGHFGYVVSGHVAVPYNRAVCKVSKELTRAISFAACPLPGQSWAASVIIEMKHSAFVCSLRKLASAQGVISLPCTT